MRYFPWGLRGLFAKPFHLPFEKVMQLPSPWPIEHDIYPATPQDQSLPAPRNPPQASPRTAAASGLLRFTGQRWEPSMFTLGLAV